MSIDTSRCLAKNIRIEALRMVAKANASHIGGAISMVDLLAVLYSDILNVQPDQPDLNFRDRFILSKAHSCTALYATLALKGFFPNHSVIYGSVNMSKLAVAILRTSNIGTDLLLKNCVPLCWSATCFLVAIWYRWA